MLRSRFRRSHLRRLSLPGKAPSLQELEMHAHCVDVRDGRAVTEQHAGDLQQVIQGQRLNRVW